MENVIKVGIGVMIKRDNKILLGHRVRNAKDTGGIYEPDSWTLPGGKQEYNETIYECAIRETKEETDLDLDINDLKVFNVADDIQPNKHYITVQIIANNSNGIPKVMEPNKIDNWQWFKFDELPENIYSPSKKFIEKYKKEEDI